MNPLKALLRLKFLIKILIMAAGIACFAAVPAFSQNIPDLTGYVNDYAKMISPETVSALTEKLSALEKSDSTQVVILTVDSLEGYPIEDYAIKVGEKWKIGQEKKDNGVILIVGKNDRRMRIEVGRGLQSSLTDILSGRIIDNVITPEFKQGNFDAGFANGIDAIISAVRGEFKSDPNALKSKKSDEISELSIFMFIAGFIIVSIISGISRIAGGIAGAIACPIIFLIFIGSFGIILGIILAVIGLIAGILGPTILSSVGSHHSGRGGGFGSGSSSSSDFGGFSGGGGIFDGGGASGGW